MSSSPRPRANLRATTRSLASSSLRRSRTKLPTRTRTPKSPCWKPTSTQHSAWRLGTKSRAAWRPNTLCWRTTATPRVLLVPHRPTVRACSLPRFRCMRLPRQLATTGACLSRIAGPWRGEAAAGRSDSGLEVQEGHRAGGRIQQTNGKPADSVGTDKSEDELLRGRSDGAALKFPLNKGGSAKGAGVVVGQCGQAGRTTPWREATAVSRPQSLRAAPFVKGECCPLLTR